MLDVIMKLDISQLSVILAFVVKLLIAIYVAIIIVCCAITVV
jgi:hypothetical protein